MVSAMLEAYQLQDAYSRTDSAKGQVDPAKLHMTESQDYDMILGIRGMFHTRYRLSNDVPAGGMPRALEEFEAVDQRFRLFCSRHGVQYTPYPTDDRMSELEIDQVTEARRAHAQGSVELKKALQRIDAANTRDRLLMLPLRQP